MNHRDTDASRRRFIRAGLAGVAALQGGALLHEAAATELPRLEESDPTAKALAYVHDASSLDAGVQVDTSHVCATCRFYTNASDAWGPCGLFPGKAVAAQGWCKAWVVRA